MLHVSSFASYDTLTAPICSPSAWASSTFPSAVLATGRCSDLLSCANVTWLCCDTKAQHDQRHVSGRCTGRVKVRRRACVFLHVLPIVEPLRHHRQIYGTVWVWKTLPDSKPQKLAESTANEPSNYRRTGQKGSLIERYSTPHPVHTCNMTAPMQQLIAPMR
jgi:hypothetical protein